MNAKPILVSLTALFTVFLVLQLVSAYELVTSDVRVEVNGVEYVTTETIALFAGETIPIKVEFMSAVDEDDVRVKAWISGYRSEISDSTERFDVFKDKTYTTRLSLKLPSDIDEREDVDLIVRIETKNKADESKYNLAIQRGSYELEILSVEADKKVVAGDTLKVTVVLSNRGLHETEDTFAIVRIPALDVESKVYFGDLTPVDEEDGCCGEDAIERKASLVIPADAKEGTYKLEVEAYNPDATTSISRDIVVAPSEEVSRVISVITSKTVAAGEDAVFDIVIVNPSNRLKVYTILPEENPGVSVTLDEPTVTVPADSSRTVKVKASALEKGTYSFAVSVNSDNKLVDRAALAMNVSGKKAIESSVIILTIVLAIVFIVLLIVLIALLTRKPTKSEESEESYY